MPPWGPAQALLPADDNHGKSSSELKAEKRDVESDIEATEDALAKAGKKVKKAVATFEDVNARWEAAKEARRAALDEARRDADEIANQQAQQILDLRQAVEKNGGEHSAQLSQLHKDLEQAQSQAREDAAAALKSHEEQFQRLAEEHEHALAERDSRLEGASARINKLEEDSQVKAAAHSEELRTAQEEAHLTQVGAFTTPEHFSNTTCLNAKSNQNVAVPRKR